MSVMVNGMNMPNDCGTCFVGDRTICSDGCPLVESPAEDDAPVVHGKWINDSDGLPVCSECGEIALQRILLRFKQQEFYQHFVFSKYCPNCGAKMDGE